MPFILLAIIIFTIILDSTMPILLKQFFYSISLTIKSIIIFLLPLIIFGFLFQTSLSLANNAIKIIPLILVLVCFSNFISTFLSHYVGELVYSFNLSLLNPQTSDTLLPLWTLNLPSLIGNGKAMFGGIMLGIMSFKLFHEKAKKISQKIKIYLTFIMDSFIFIIPLFIIGFIVKLQYDKVIMLIIKDYTIVFVIIALAQTFYILFIYFLLSNLQIKKLLNNIKNMLPATISGFSTMSSATSMPFTIIGVENNTENKELARAIVPVTVNIHLIGDCIAIPILAYAILKSFGVAPPSLFNYIIFTFYFVVAKFSVAAIPGGGIIVMLPILQNYLGFNDSMLSLITALYILFDPVITCINVLGNGAFAQLIDKFIKKLKIHS